MIKTCSTTGKPYIDLADIANIDRYISKALRPYTRVMIKIGFFSFFASFVTAFYGVGN